jgi:GNAT superfamily N-acetyltransferase
VLAKRLPGYPSVRVARLGRLAVDQAYRGRKLGSALLWDAVQRSLRSEIAVFALVVDAKDDQAEAFLPPSGLCGFRQPTAAVRAAANGFGCEGWKACYSIRASPRSFASPGPTSKFLKGAGVSRCEGSRGS